MEQQIKQTACRVRLFFTAFWLVAVAFVVCGEIGGDWVGAYADDERTIYLAETLLILLTALCVPVSLKLFAWVLVHKIDRVSLPVALRLYLRWSGVRLLLLSLPVLSGLLAYYLLLSGTGALCALIGLTASLFCLPGEERLRRDLQIDSDAPAN